MKCLICGRLSLPGAKLCLDCKAARKRAFDATVTQPLLAAAGAARNSRAVPRLLKPSQSVPDAARRAAKIALAAQAQSKIASEAAEPAPRRAARWPMIAAGTFLVLVVVGYFGHWFGAGKSGTFAAVPDRPVLESAAEASIVRASTPSTIAVPEGAVTVVPVVSDAAAVEPQVPATKADAVKRPTLRARTEKVPVTLPPPEAPPEVVAVAPPPPPPVVREAPRVDPFQAMIDAIARCPRNDIFGRATCEQRMRAQYCEGHWGQVPQCASIPYVDHGQ
jgi:hypothetical protein